MDVENIDALNPVELDALLERALDPHVPVEVFYAVLERIGPHEPPAQAASGPTSQGTKSADQQPNGTSPSPVQQAVIGRRVAQHGPPPRGFAVPVAGLEASAVLRPVTDAGSGAAVPPPDTAVSPTAQTTVMSVVPASDADDRAA